MHTDLASRILGAYEARASHDETLSAKTVLETSGMILGRQQTASALQQLEAHLHALGPLQPLVEDPLVTDILVNGTDPVWVERGGDLQVTDIRFPSSQDLGEFIARLVSRVGRRIDLSNPSVDAALAGGIRLHAVLPPIAVAGPVLSLRISRHGDSLLSELVQANLLPKDLAGHLRQLVRERIGILICGGTGSGKTTLLGALLAEVPAEQRIVCIEDTHEIRARHPHLVNLVARETNAEGTGEVTLADLVRQALRMRPDRLVLGEMRGHEITQVLQAANTGHRGTLATVHANSLDAVIARLEFLALSAGLPLATWQRASLEAFQVAVFLERGPHGRRVSSVGELHIAAGQLRVTPVWQRGTEVS